MIYDKIYQKNTNFAHNKHQQIKKIIKAFLT